MVILVCGGRNYDNGQYVNHVLDVLKPTRIVHGGCRGADTLASKWAQDHFSVIEKVYPADWSRGPKAGPERNRFMLRAERPDLVIAFPGGKGTQNMKRLALNHGYVVLHANELHELQS